MDSICPQLHGHIVLFIRIPKNIFFGSNTLKKLCMKVADETMPIKQHLIVSSGLMGVCMQDMVLLLDGNSEHVVNALRKKTYL